MTQHFLIKGNEIFPGNRLPALLYKHVIKDPAPLKIMEIFEHHGWTNSWDAGIFTYHHYHSITHEVLGIYSGNADIQLGGDQGPVLHLEAGDVLIIPAGVAHRNLGEENDVGVIGAYPDGKHYDMNYGKPGERPQADMQIAAVPLPAKNPVTGEKEFSRIWESCGD